MHTGAPFTVHESEAPLTVPDDLHLATEDRAVERNVFDAQVAEKIRQDEVCPPRPEQCCCLLVVMTLDLTSSRIQNVHHQATDAYRAMQSR